MNKKIYEVLEFDRIIDLINRYTVTASGEENISNLQAITDKNKVEKQLNQTSELRTINIKTKGLPLKKIDDLFDIFKRLEIRATLSATELSRLKPNLVVVSNIIDFIDSLSDTDFFIELIETKKLVDRLVDFPNLQNEISNSISDNGTILDTATPVLTRIRRQIGFNKDEIKNILNEMTRNQMAKFLSEPTITIRDDVFVLPVKAEYRSKFGGVVHDQSQSGQTLYIEPAKTSSINESIHELLIEERREENKILQDISAQLFEQVDQLKNNNQIIGMIDAINAKAKLALEQKAIRPLINSEKKFNLINAIHPLLDNENAVSNTVELGDEYSALIVTGPNTGGKTVLMKTVGLLELMAQAGLFITAENGSSVYIFDEILADIGDEQSLEQNLSTFSSHMVNIKNILKVMTGDSLILLDELGAGTDPGEGAALAMAITQKINSLNALSIITTHYPELKIFADQNSYAMNSSMEFDAQTLKPTYRLLVGIPGQSNALLISKKIGLDDEIILDAEKYIDPKSQELNNLIIQLVEKQQEITKLQLKLDAELKEAENTKNKFENESTKLEQEKAKIVLDAKNEANHLIAKAKKESEKIVAEIRNERLKSGGGNGRNEQELQKLVSSLDKNRENVELEKNKVLQKAKNKKKFEIGEDVLVEEYNQVGVITKKLDNDKYEVKMGILSMVVDGFGIQKTIIKSEKPKLKSRQVRVVKTTSNTSSGTIDLRGYRYEDALNQLDKYLDTAVLNNLGTVEIIHGKGTGALRSGVTSMLRSDRRVANFQFANPNGAGDGATIVELT